MLKHRQSTLSLLRSLFVTFIIVSVTRNTNAAPSSAQCLQFSSDGHSDLFLANPDNKTIQPLPNGLSARPYIEDPTSKVSPDGRYVAQIQPALVVRDRRTGRLATIQAGAIDLFEWSPDSRKIAYSAREDT